MSLNAQSMANKIRAHMDAAASAQTTDAANAAAQADDALVAMCQGIIDEFVENAVIINVMAGGDTGKVT